ncbi:MAG: carboxypeptidase regulatory-like domain-containing protein [Candidatus Omnitrophica bacterium]|nr:carboxypeptidase regulatory-like domain-containing protein [Candidatus Omnitrophota bacterium]
MPRILPFFLFATTLVSLSVSPIVAQESVPFPRDPAYIHDPNQRLFDQLTQTDIPFEFRPAFPDRLEIWVSDKEFQDLAEQGLNIEWVPEEDQVYWETPKGVAEEFVTPATSYPTFEQLTAFLQKKASDYPDLCRLESIGQSVQGRDLWFLRISDNPDLEEDEPEFKYISTIHGDEIVGVAMMLNLIDLLLEGYGVDQRLTDLVNDTEIWIMPLMNTDGFARNPRRRTNANGFDLNRSFPDRVGDPVNTPEGRQPEVQAMMNFGFNHSSVFSANFHGGALLMNYPYDSDFSIPEGPPTIPPQPGWFSPDNDVFEAVSLIYSMNNPPMFASPFFENGITNGISWYSVWGGMQDWNYVWLACNEVTIEMSNDKGPAGSTLPQFWEENRESMLSYMEQVHIGVRGLVTDSRSGRPLAATVIVEGRDHEVFTDQDVGDYHRMLLPGTYTLTFSADGYRPKTVENVIVEEGEATRVDVELGLDVSLLTVR